MGEQRRMGRVGTGCQWAAGPTAHSPARGGPGGPRQSHLQSGHKDRLERDCLVCEVRPPVGAGVVHRAVAGAWRAGQGCSKEALETGRAFHLCPTEMFPEACAAQGMLENQADRKALSAGSDTPHQDPRPSPSVLMAAGTWPRAPHQAGPPGPSSGLAAGAHLTSRAPLNLPCPRPRPHLCEQAPHAACV